MIKKLNVGLVRLADAGSVAANEDRTPVALAAAESKDSGSASGWDPYEVWRTRIKSARDTRSKIDSDGPAV